MNTLLIFTVVSIVSLLVVVGLNILMARRHGWLMGVIRVGATLISAIIAIPISKWIAGKIALPIEEAILKGDIATLLAAAPTGTAAVDVILTLVIAPLLFAFVFVLIRVLFTIILKIVEVSVPALKKDKGPYKWTLPIAAVNGILLMLVFLAPLCSFLALGGNALGQLPPDTANAPMPAEISNMVTGQTNVTPAALGIRMTKNPVVVVVDNTVGKPIFHFLTSGEVAPTATDPDKSAIKVELSTELSDVLGVVNALDGVTETLKKENPTTEDLAQLDALVDDLMKNRLFKSIATELIKEIGTQWQTPTGTLLGKTRPSLPSEVTPTFTAFMKFLSSTEYQYVEGDVKTIVLVFDELLVADIVDTSISAEELSRRLSDSGVIATAMEILRKNDRTAYLADEVQVMCVRVVTSMLGVDKIQNGEHDEMLNNVAGQLNDIVNNAESKEDRDNKIIAAVTPTFEKYNYNIPNDVVVEIADKIIAEKGQDGAITKEDLKQFLIDHADDEDLFNKLPDGAGDKLDDYLDESGDIDDLLESIPDDLLESLPDLLESIPDDLDDLLESVPDDLDDLLESVPEELPESLPVDIPGN